MYLATEFAPVDQPIICSIPPNDVRVNLKDRLWMKDGDNLIVDPETGNSLNVSMILLGWRYLHGNIGLRKFQDFIDLLFVPVSPIHRHLPKGCVSRVLIAGKSSQDQFLQFWSMLYQNRISPISIVTQTKFASKTFAKKDPVTGADLETVSYSFLTFQDRKPANEHEMLLIAEISEWLKTQEGRDLTVRALSFPHSGGNLIELPQGGDHNALRAEFYNNPLNHAQITGTADLHTANLPQGVVEVPATPVPQQVQEEVYPMPKVDPKYLEMARQEQGLEKSTKVGQNVPF